MDQFWSSDDNMDRNLTFLTTTWIVIWFFWQQHGSKLEFFYDNKDRNSIFWRYHSSKFEPRFCVVFWATFSSKFWAMFLSNFWSLLSPKFWAIMSKYGWTMLTTSKHGQLMSNSSTRVVENPKMDLVGQFWPNDAEKNPFEQVVCQGKFHFKLSKSRCPALFSKIVGNFPTFNWIKFGLDNWVIKATFSGW